MKRNKRVNKYTKLTTEASEPICPICGEHTIKTEIEPVEYKIDDDIFTMNEMFFRCHKNPGEQYATAEMVNHNNNQEKLPKRVWNGLKTGVTNTIAKTKEFVIEHPLAATIIVSSAVKLTKAGRRKRIMTKEEKNERIKTIEEQIDKLQKELEDIHNTEIQEWDFSTWDKIPLRKRYEFDIPADTYAIIPFNNRLDELSKLTKFKFCYDRSYVPNFDDTTEKYYIMFSNRSGKYEISYNFNIKIPGVVYFSSEKIAKKCADWMNEGCPGYLEEEKDERNF